MHRDAAPYERVDTGPLPAAGLAACVCWVSRPVACFDAGCLMLAVWPSGRLAFWAFRIFSLRCTLCSSIRASLGFLKCWCWCWCRCLCPLHPLSHQHQSASSMRTLLAFCHTRPRHSELVCSTDVILSQLPAPRLLRRRLGARGRTGVVERNNASASLGPFVVIPRPIPCPPHSAHHAPYLSAARCRPPAVVHPPVPPSSTLATKARKTTRLETSQQHRRKPRAVGSPCLRISGGRVQFARQHVPSSRRVARNGRTHGRSHPPTPPKAPFPLARRQKAPAQ